MKKLTDDQISKLKRPYNKETGVNAITEEMLRKVDIDSIPTVIHEYKDYCKETALLMSNGMSYKRDRFTPRSGSYAFKPSYAGGQILIGKFDDDSLIYSNGVWFSTFTPSNVKEMFPELFDDHKAS